MIYYNPRRGFTHRLVRLVQRIQTSRWAAL